MIGVEKQKNWLQFSRRKTWFRSIFGYLYKSVARIRIDKYYIILELGEYLVYISYKFLKWYIEISIELFFSLET